MPLSENEEQILADIERRLAEEDPKFADTVSNATLATHLAHRLRWSILGFIAGFLLLLGFVVSVWIAAAGFALMVGCAFMFYLAMKQLGQEQLRAMANSGTFTIPGLLSRFARRGPEEHPSSQTRDEDDD